MKKLMKSGGIAVLAACVLVITGCRVPDDSQPRVIPSGQVPFDLLAPAATAPPVTSPLATADGKVYFIKEGRVIAAPRSIPEPLSLGTLLSALVQGPTPEESANGFTNSVGPQASVLNVQVTDQSAVIDISDSFSGIGVQEQIDGLAQIVYTATELPGIQDVKIQLNARLASVPRGDGSATTDPLTRADYPTLAPQ